MLVHTYLSIVYYCVLLYPTVSYCVLLCTIVYYYVLQCPCTLLFSDEGIKAADIYMSIFQPDSLVRAPAASQPHFHFGFRSSPINPTRPHSSALFLYSLLTVSALTPRCAPRGLRGGCPPLPLLCPQPNNIEASACRKHRLLLMLATWLCRLMCNSSNSMTVVSF